MDFLKSAVIVVSILMMISFGITINKTIMKSSENTEVKAANVESTTTNNSFLPSYTCEKLLLSSSTFDAPIFLKCTTNTGVVCLYAYRYEGVGLSCDFSKQKVVTE